MTATEPKRKFPAADALAVAKELCAAIKPVTEALIVAGSLRRRRPQVGDVEILFIPKKRIENDPTVLRLGDEPKMEVDEVELALWRLTLEGMISRRKNARGNVTWGPQNKLALHAASGIPVDLFAAKPENWWNLVVCRTGNAAHNIRLCQSARAKGWKWSPYGEGFYDNRGTLVYRVNSERDVFDGVGLKWREPWERNV
jgi:DNA polymerase/3'-5' exonuclease PolX